MPHLVANLSAPTLLLVGAWVAGGSACSARADIPEVVVTQSEVMFDGVPRLDGVDITTSLSTSFDHPEGFEVPDGFDSELRPLGVVVEGYGDMHDLAFIDGLRLTLASRDPNGPEPADVVTYTRQAGDAGPMLDVAAEDDTNVIDYWKTNSAFYQLTVVGDLPEQQWGVNVTVRFSGSLSVSAL